MNKKVAKLAAKAALKAEQDKITKLQPFYSSYFCDKNHFEDDGTQSYLVLQPMYRYCKKIEYGDHISSWKSKGLSDESIKLPSTSNNTLAPSLNYIGTRTKRKFDGRCLEQDKITYTYGKTVNIYIVYKINLSDRGHDDYLTLENS